MAKNQKCILTCEFPLSGFKKKKSVCLCGLPHKAFFYYSLCREVLERYYLVNVRKISGLSVVWCL